MSGRCKEAADLLVRALGGVNIKASKHFGWCLYDTCDNISGEPCAPHCYVLIHNGNERCYLDVTATQFQHSLHKPITKVIILGSGDRPYWFRSAKPSLKDMERTSDYR